MNTSKKLEATKERDFSGYSRIRWAGLPELTANLAKENEPIRCHCFGLLVFKANLDRKGLSVNPETIQKVIPLFGRIFDD